MKILPETDRIDLLLYGLMLLAAAMLYLFIYSDMPIYGDAWGYGYKCSSWLADNGLPLIPSGTGRGETAGGHAAFYFWLWAVLIKVIGNGVRTAHLLPSFFVFLTLAGTYRSGRELGGRTMGILSSAVLLVTPLFLAQSFRPLPIAAAMAFSVWSFFYYLKKKYLVSSLLCALAVMMREQALLLALSYILAEFYFVRENGKGLNWKRIGLFVLPFLVPVVNGIANRIVNGYFFAQGNRPGIGGNLSTGLFLHRLKHFGFFLTGSYRWLIASIGTGLVLSRTAGRRTGAAVGLLLLVTGAIPRFQNYFTVILLVALLYLVIFRKGRINRYGFVLSLFPLLMVLAFTGIVFLASTVMQYLFFRYLMPALPLLILGLTWAVFSCRIKLFRYTAYVFMVLTFTSCFTVRFRENYSDTTPAGYMMPLLAMRDAGTWAAGQGLPVLAAGGAAMHFSNTDLGYTDSSLTTVSLEEAAENPAHRVYSVVVPPLLPWTDDGKANLERFITETAAPAPPAADTVFIRGPFKAECLILDLETD